VEARLRGLRGQAGMGHQPLRLARLIGDEALIGEDVGRQAEPLAIAPGQRGCGGELMRGILRPIAAVEPVRHVVRHHRDEDVERVPAHRDHRRLREGEVEQRQIDFVERHLVGEEGGAVLRQAVNFRAGKIEVAEQGGDMVMVRRRELVKAMGKGLAVAQHPAGEIAQLGGEGQLAASRDPGMAGEELFGHRRARARHPEDEERLRPVAPSDLSYFREAHRRQPGEVRLHAMRIIAAAGGGRERGLSAGEVAPGLLITACPVAQATTQQERGAAHRGLSVEQGQRLCPARVAGEQSRAEQQHVSSFARGEAGGLLDRAVGGIEVAGLLGDLDGQHGRCEQARLGAGGFGGEGGGLLQRALPHQVAREVEQQVRMPPGERDGAAQMPRALDQRFPPGQEGAEHRMGIGVRGRHRHRLADFGFGLGRASRVEQQPGEIVARPAGIRRDRDDPAQLALGGRRVSLLPGGEGEDFEGVDGSGLGGKHVARRRDGGIEAARAHRLTGLLDLHRNHGRTIAGRRKRTSRRPKPAAGPRGQSFKPTRA